MDHLNDDTSPLRRLYERRRVIRIAGFNATRAVPAQAERRESCTRGADGGNHAGWRFQVPMPNRLRPYLLTFLVATSALAAACSTIDTASSPVAPMPGDCSEPAKLFDWFSMRVKTLTWIQDEKQKETGTLTIVFTFLNTDRLPRALSNSGTGYLYAVEYSLKGDDGTMYTATDPSGVLVGNEMHAAIEYNMSKEGTLKFKVPKGNYSVIFGRKFDGKLMTKYDFLCTIAVR